MKERIMIVLSVFRFLLQCLEDLDSSLRKLNSRLFVVRGQPADVFPKLFKVQWSVVVISQIFRRKFWLIDWWNLGGQTSGVVTNLCLKFCFPLITFSLLTHIVA